MKVAAQRLLNEHAATPRMGAIAMRRFQNSAIILALAAVCASAGCNANPIMLMAYLLNNDDPKTKAEFPLKPRPKHEKEEVKVVLLTSCATDLSPDMVGVDRLLAAEFIPLLESRCLENKEKVKVLKSQPIEAYKRDNPDWRNQSPYEIGENLKADWVIDIEVLDISIYEPNTNRELMQGRATVAVRAYDLSKPLREPAFSPPEYNIIYPRGHPVSRYDERSSTFRQKFVKRMVQDLVLPFAAHTSQQKVVVD